jgi:hypothetical protein
VLLEQFLCVRTRLGGDRSTAQHPCQLIDPRITRKPRQLAADAGGAALSISRAPAVGLLAHQEVMVGAGGDLRQVGHAQHLALRRK